MKLWEVHIPSSTYQFQWKVGALNALSAYKFKMLIQKYRSSSAHNFTTWGRTGKKHTMNGGMFYTCNQCDTMHMCISNKMIASFTHNYADGTIQRMQIADVLGETEDYQLVYLPGEEENSWPGEYICVWVKQNVKQNVRYNNLCWLHLIPLL